MVHFYFVPAHAMVKQPQQCPMASATTSASGTVCVTDHPSRLVIPPKMRTWAGICPPLGTPNGEFATGSHAASRHLRIETSGAPNTGRFMMK